MRFVGIPHFLKKLFPSLTWDYNTGEKVVYITFDDGPIPQSTAWTLKLLKEKNVKATFFCVGDNVRKHPEIYQRILDEGHRVGNHTFNHVNGWKLRSSNYLRNIIKAKRYIQSNLFRPPYGKLIRPQIKWLQKEGYTIVMWDVLTKDYDAKILPQECLNRSLKAKEGSIILFHDSLKAETNLRYALPKFIELKLSEGFHFGLISDETKPN